MRAAEAGTVAGDEWIRLFCALTLGRRERDAFAAWQASLVVEAAREVRRVPAEQLHVTLAFLGRRRRTDARAVGDALRDVSRDAGPIHLSPQRYRETRSAGMVVCGDEGGRAGTLAADLHERLRALGIYEPEARPWLPHVTVLRFRSRPRLAADPAALGVFSPSGAAVYHSVLAPGGARYAVLETVSLGG